MALLWLGGHGSRATGRRLRDDICNAGHAVPKAAGGRIEQPHASRLGASRIEKHHLVAARTEPGTTGKSYDKQENSYCLAHGSSIHGLGMAFRFYAA